ncbi:MAG: U32 family peptidase [Treponemataceae bacterium]|nr:U32 family peptidase [Treponemataceae bacterium]
MSELLAPAGNIEALDAAIGEGADAVYMGLKSFNARLRSSNFAWNQFEAAVESVHRQGKKIYVTVNTVAEESETERLYRFLEYLESVGPDGIIVQDFGVVRMVQEFFPKLKLHASTQMNVASARAVNILGKEGFSRVVLARELSLEEIRAIKAASSCELEVFVHGALCVSESGLCLFSSFLGGKSANRGMCTQACRRLYTADFDGREETGYYFSPYDLQLIDRIPQLMEAGVESFKIEGRMKSAEYVGSVTAAYRYVMDHWQEDKKGAIATGRRILSTDFARTKTRYWFDSDKAENLLDPKQAGGTGIYLGKIEQVKSDGPEVRFARIVGGSYDPDVGDSIRLHRKDDTGRESHKIKQIKTIDGEQWIDIPTGFSRGDPVYLLQTKAMSKRYDRVLPKDLSRYRKQPGGGQVPVMDLSPVPRTGFDYFPDGLYVQVSTLRDLHVIAGGPQVRSILELTKDTARDLLDPAANIPFSRRQMILSLDPYCPQADEPELAETVQRLIEAGYATWIVNNPSHFSMIRGKKTAKGEPAHMIAGPYLYTFNRWAASWLENQDIETFVTPLENSRDNLEETFEPALRRKVMVSLFAYPALFRMRFHMPDSYDFVYFKDKEEMEFKVLSAEQGSYVMPEKPFSVVDARQRLERMGVSHFLLDFSKNRIEKSDYKFILKALNKGEVIPDTSRFNWKDGFYSPEKIERYQKARERAEQTQSNRKNSYGKGRSSKTPRRPSGR